MTDLLTFIEASMVRASKSKWQARTCWNSQMLSLKGRQQRQERKSSGRAMSNTSPRRRQSIFWACVMRPYGIGLVRAISSPSSSVGGCSTVVPTSSGSWTVDASFSKEMKRERLKNNRFLGLSGVNPRKLSRLFSNLSVMSRSGIFLKPQKQDVCTCNEHGGSDYKNVYIIVKMRFWK